MFIACTHCLFMHIYYCHHVILICFYRMTNTENLIYLAIEDKRLTHIKNECGQDNVGKRDFDVNARDRHIHLRVEQTFTDSQICWFGIL